MPERSITCAPAGTATFGPTSRILLPSTTMIWLVRTRPASGSRRRPARIAVIGTAVGCAAAMDAATRSAGAAPAIGFNMRVKLSRKRRPWQSDRGGYGCDVVETLPPDWRVYLLNQLIMYSCVRMKFDGFDPVPWYSSLNWSSFTGTPRTF